MTVASILDTKGAKVVTVRPEATIATVLRLFERENIGAVAVSSDDARAVDMISERDIIHGLARHGGGVTALRADELMRPAPTCRLGDSLEDIMARMTNSRQRHLLAVDEGAFCGVISIGDVVKLLLDDLRLENNVLRDAYMATHSRVA